MTWSTTTGFDDPEEITVTHAYFAQSQDFGLALNWEGTDEHGREQRLLFPCGKTWQDRENGARAIVLDAAGKPLPPEKQGFNRRSWAGIMVQGLIDTGISDQLARMGRDEPTLAATWIGLKWALKRVEYDFGRTVGKKDRLLPCRLLGIAAPAPCAPLPTPALAPSVPSPTGPPPVPRQAVLAALAAQAPDLATFQTLAAYNPELMADPGFVNMLYGPAGEPFFQSLKHPVVV